MAKPLPNAPKRGLNKGKAANYIGISVRKFDAMMKAGTMPKPRLLFDDMRHGDNVKNIWNVRELMDILTDSRPKVNEAAGI